MAQTGVIVVAIGILLIAGAGPAMAVDSGRARGGDPGSISDLCNQFKHEYQQLSDKKRRGTLTRDDQRRMTDLNGQIKSMCSN
jgi:hypothetical protein